MGILALWNKIGSRMLKCVFVLTFFIVRLSICQFSVILCWYETNSTFQGEGRQCLSGKDSLTFTGKMHPYLLSRRQSLETQYLAQRLQVYLITNKIAHSKENVKTLQIWLNR